MRIDGLVVCVGEHYAKTLTQALPVWLNTLDSLWVITDRATLGNTKVDAMWIDECRYYCTDIFYRYGAHFNKGAALSEAFYFLNPQDWILNIDADIIPPANWRKIAEPQLQIGKLYGCKRHYDANKKDTESDSAFPDIWGYFHLWNVADSHSWVRPVYPVDCGHAGNYDHTFMLRWPESERVELPFTVQHIGPPRNNWFGQAPDARKRMDELYELGLHNAWFTKAGHIKVPEPDHYVVHKEDCFNVVTALQHYSRADPFFYTVVVK